MHRVGIATLLAALGCASYQVNPPLAEVDLESGYRYEALERPETNSERTFVILTLSGGGTRAAALAYGAFLHLENTPIADGRTLLDEVDVISSVSGGSFANAYYALSKSKGDFFDEFPDAVLYRRIQSALIKRVLAPWNWPRLLSPRFGRSDLLNLYYDRKIFKGRAYGDMPQRLPFAILNGTDMSLGAHFPFTQVGFDRLCSDLSGVKVSRAVISSSAFPGAFTPLTWRNYPKERCGFEQPEWVDLTFGDGKEDFGELEDVPGHWDRARVEKSYELPDRPFIHVIDGGASDNIGLRGPLAAISSDDPTWSVMRKVNFGEVDRLVVIVVDAKPRDRPKRDTKASPPGLLSVLATASSKPMANYSTETVELLRRDFEDWDRDALDYAELRPHCVDLAGAGCRESTDPRCRETLVARCQELFFLAAEDAPPHPTLYRVHVRFDAIRDPKLRSELQAVPTTLQLPRPTVDKLVAVVPVLLDQSADFQRLKRDLAAPDVGSGGGG